MLGTIMPTIILMSPSYPYRTQHQSTYTCISIRLRYHIIDKPGVLENNVLHARNHSYDLRVILNGLDDFNTVQYVY